MVGTSDILFEDNHLIVVVKKSGQTVQPEDGKPISLEEEVKEYIKKKYQKPGAVFLGVVHRLDMPVSGIVVFARTSKALTRMNEIFRNKKSEKLYVAELADIPNEAEASMVHWLKSDETINRTKAFRKEVEGAYRAELKYFVESTQHQRAIVRIQLITGRKHQIRAQFSAIKCPIVGDVKYGAPSPLPDQSIRLHAYKLSFEHPIKKEWMEFESEADWMKN